MYSIKKDLTTGVISITDQYTSNVPNFANIGDTYAMSFIDLTGVQSFKSFTYSTIGEIDSRYLQTSYRVSRDSNKWTDWLDLNTTITNFPPFNVKNTMYIDIKWERVGDSTIGNIELDSYGLNGVIVRNLTDGLNTTTLSSLNPSAIIKPPYIYKVFSLTDLEIISGGDFNNVNIQYRFSQDYGRTVSAWEPLTKENISTVRINPIRFFQIEYLLQYTGSSSAKIYDINLIGDFQNVSLDGLKTNLYGSREDCDCIMLSIVGGTQSDGNTDNMLSVGSCDSTFLTPMTPTDISKLFQPYAQTQALDLLNKLGNDSVEIFGHDVVYFLTDPDKNGIDHSFHEYQLYNYVCSEMIKVAVDGNNFPDNQIIMNQFDLSLFESFEIHITKDQFKSAFGVEKRPSKEDFLWFCEVNRMFQVEHAQPFRNFNNSTLYYKVMLKKYSQKSSIAPVNQSIADKVRELTKNSTIDELFGLENSLDKKEIANPEQTRTLTQDLLRLEFNAKIDKELIENSTNVIAKSNYDLSSVTYDTPAVTYRNFRNHFRVSDNFSFMMWFSINNYTVNDTYNFIKYYDDVNQLGFKVNLQADNIIFTLNQNAYNFRIGNIGNANALQEDIWYAYVINVDQRHRKLNQYIYKRNVDNEKDAAILNSSILRSVYTQEDILVPVEFELENINFALYGSDMKATNIRVFNDVVPVSEHNKILNQSIIGRDERYLIFSDNANMRITLPNLPYNQVDTNIVRGEVNKDNLKPPTFPPNI